METYDLESLLETLDILRDEELVESIRQSRREAAEGKSVPLSDYLAALGDPEHQPCPSVD